MIAVPISQPEWLAFSVVLGLCVGSFLNVVAYRLPKMMQREWDTELALANGQTPPESAKPFNLALPASHCPSCQNRLRFYHNIPVVSYLLLRGRCAFCGCSVSIRYPVVEVCTGLLFGWIAVQHAPGLAALCYMALSANLLVLALIDFDTFLLPDSITQPLLWAGLAFNMLFKSVPLEQAVFGAMLGYLMLWSIYKLFKAFTGKEGMGYGDFKLLAALGAWFGPLSLMTIVLVASVSGILLGLSLQALRNTSRSEPFPFGPSLVLGAFAWMAGLDLAHWI